MTTGFDANVPARKPRTISRVLTELTAVPENAKPAANIELTAALPVPGKGMAHLNRWQEHLGNGNLCRYK